MANTDTLKQQFLLDPNITFLNFGSFGACPKPIFQKYQELQLLMEQEPVKFITQTSLDLLQQSRAALGAYLNCSEKDIVCVTNPSYAVNIVAKNLQLQPEDEILTTDLEYGACDKTWNYYCKKQGARYIRHHVPLPITAHEEWLNSFEQQINAKTKLIFISHITSITALILPVQAICDLGKKYGIPVFIDGAHAPAHVTVDLKALGCDYYTGACHKWMMAPKGSSFLFVKPEQQIQLDPLVVSWGYDSMIPSSSIFLDYHQMQGTRDLSAFCTIPSAIEFMNTHNWEDVKLSCRTLVKDNALQLCHIAHTQPLAPLEDEYIGQMFSCELPIHNPALFHDDLYNKFKIQIPVMIENGKAYTRFSIQAFNSQQDLDALFTAVETLLSHNVYN